jgi:hypothetical protein
MSLLQQSKYPQYSNNPHTVYTRTDCQNLIQASDAELSKYCQQIDVIEIGGHMRLLSREALMGTTRDMFDTIIAGSLDIADLSFEQLLGQMASGNGGRAVAVDTLLLRHVLRSLSASTEGTGDGDHWVLDAGKVQTASADLLLFEYYCGDQAKKVCWRYSAAFVCSYYCCYLVLVS